MMSKKDIEVINSIKGLALDMIDKAGSGHPGIVLGAAPILYALYKDHLNVVPSKSDWINRDRFVMSAGHGSALLYATLFMVGYALTVEDLKKFRRIGSKTPGHPEKGVTPGVDCSTGPLGQGFANAVGMALGEKAMQERYRINPSKSLVDYKVYALVGDGDLMEGISYEAASLAGNLKLNNLIVLYDSNDVSLDGPTSKTFTENVRGRFEALGWNTIFVKEGDKVSEIDKAIDKAKKSSLPTLIEVKTKIGKDSLLEGQCTIHGKDLEEDDITQLKSKLGLPTIETFYVNSDACSKFRSHIANRVNKRYLEWSNTYQEYVNKVADGNKTEANYLFQNVFNYNLFDLKFDFKVHTKQALRETNMYFMQELGKNIKTFIGGSADLGSTTKTYVSEFADITHEDFSGNNIWYGVREHAMGAISNGLALVNLKPFCSTFLSFSDYLKPAMRMSALMNLPVTYIYTHDSISVGPDGPTHQPIEQLAMLRSIPGMKVYRPADAKELLGCWQRILNSNSNPSSLILARNEVEVMEESNAIEAMNGGYILHQETSPLKLILVATGTEVHVAKNLALEFSRMGENGIRVVSLPCMENFLEKDTTYQETVLPSRVLKIAIEAGSTFGWHRIISNPNHVIGVETFGASGSKDEVLDAMNFSYEKIKGRVLNILRNL